ncbi:hypothetical protein L3X38_030555 [Prunus dulcis]|uniref:Uncharacterized protein n=1 Tax=Prunus dulcis TaxID=3755 RepID=A0AAD4VBN6_PRUDU|nr:hypothetical protein L3X38_030555 [Prunus dulcis]
MDLVEIDELPKKGLREEACRAFRLQASASMDMLLCMERAINAAESAKRAYDDGHSKVAESGKVLQDHANLIKEKEGLERQVKTSEEKLAEMRGALKATVNTAREAKVAKEAVRVVLEKAKLSKAIEIEAAIREAVSQYRSSEELTVLLEFYRFNPGQKLNLNFDVDPPPLPEWLTEEMIEDYEGEDAPPESGPEAEAEADGRDVVQGTEEPDV